jgi:plasmid segregation protein ParM
MSLSEESIIDVGIDDGYAAVKVAWYGEDGAIRTLSIPSRARQGSLGIGSFGENGTVGGYETDGICYTVGADIGGSEMRIPDYNLSRTARVLAHHALIQAGFAGKVVRIASGLPLNRYFEGGNKNEERIAQKVWNFAQPVLRLDGGQTARIAAQHNVFAQGLTAAVDWFVEGGKPRPHKGRIGVVDIGGQTIDISVVWLDQKGELMTDRDNLVTEDIGVLDVHKILKRRIMSVHKVDAVSSEDLARALITGRIWIWTKDQSIEEEIIESVRSVGEQLQAPILSAFGKGISSLESILFVGGGSYLFRDLVSMFPNAVIPEQPEFANARGMLKALSMRRGA